MNNISWRHHYLPVFYLKGFTKSGKVKIFDVENQRFVKEGKEFSPQSYFFEKDANTIVNKENDRDDFLERDFAEFDHKIAELLSKINKSTVKDRYDIDDQDMPLLNHFVSLMYWRLPHKFKELTKFVEQTDFSLLGLRVHNSDGSINDNEEKKLKSNPEFIKMYRLYNSFADTVRGLHCRTPYTILEKYHELPFICSDNPVIFEKHTPQVYQDDYIFSLTGTKMFLKVNRREKFPPELWYLIDMILFKQAVKYVSCTDEKYIEILDANFKKYNLTIEELKIEIFKKLK